MNGHWPTGRVRCVVILSWALASCCSKPAPAPPADDRGAGIEATFDGPRDPQLDRAVIETALLDAVSGSNDTGKAVTDMGRGKELTFSGQGLDHYGGMMRTTLDRAVAGPWKSLPAPDRVAALAARADMIRRMNHGQPFAPFRPTDRRLSLWEDNPASTRPATRPWGLDGPRPIHLAPPGYGQDGRVALVVLQFPWSVHSGDAVYVLRRQGANWDVISRDCAIFP